MVKWFKLLIGFTLLLMVTGARAVEVVGNSVDTTISRPALRKIYMGYAYRMNGRLVKPLLLPRSSFASQDFSWKGLGVAPDTLYQRVESIQSTGIGNAPRIVENEAQMLSAVRSTPGAIGYLGRKVIISSGDTIHYVEIVD